MNPVQDQRPSDLSKESLGTSAQRPVLTRLFSEGGPGCKDGGCPSVYSVSGSTDLVIQGYVTGRERSDLSIPAGEEIVRIPRTLVDMIVAAAKAGTL